MFTEPTMRLAAALTMLMYTLGLFAVQWHHLDVEHVECAEHGQHHVDRDGEHANDEAPLDGISGLPAEASHGHHCHLLQFFEPSVHEFSEAPCLSLPQVRGHSALWRVTTTNHTRADLLRLAPKTSPPNASRALLTLA